MDKCKQCNHVRWWWADVILLACADAPLSVESCWLALCCLDHWECQVVRFVTVESNIAHLASHFLSCWYLALYCNFQNVKFWLFLAARCSQNWWQPAFQCCLPIWYLHCSLLSEFIPRFSCQYAVTYISKVPWVQSFGWFIHLILGQVRWDKSID